MQAPVCSRCCGSTSLQTPVESVRRGVSISETACGFGVDRSTVGRYLKQLEEEGSLTPKKAPGSPPKLEGSAMRLLEEDLKNHLWATHKQRSHFLFAACGVEVSETFDGC